MVSSLARFLGGRNLEKGGGGRGPPPPVGVSQAGRQGGGEKKGGFSFGFWSAAFYFGGKFHS